MHTFLFSTYPYVSLMFMLFPLSIFGLNMYFAITSFVFFILFFQILLGKYRIIDDAAKVVLVLLLFLCSILVFRTLLIDLSISENIKEILKNTMSSRISITLILYLLVSLVIIKKAGRDTISKIIVFNAFIQSLIGVIHHHFFPSLITGQPETHPGRLYAYMEGVGPFREAGTLVSPSLYANIILLGLFILGFNLLRNVEYRSIIVSVFMLYGLSLSGSRLPGIIAIVFLITILIKVLMSTFNKNNLIKIFLLTTFLLVVFSSIYVFVYPEIDSLINRFKSDGFSARAIKNNLAISVIFDNFQNFAIGTHSSNFTQIESIEGYGISDNSFLSLLLTFGAIYSVLLFFIISLLIVHRVNLSLRVIFLLGYFMTNLFLTNSIYWDLYLLYFFATLFVINDQKLKNTDHKNLKKIVH